MSIMAAGVLVALAIVFTHYAPIVQQAPAGNNPQQQAAAVLAVDIKDVNIDGTPFIGDKNAPVTVAYWTDYQCPFCKRFETTTLPQIMDNYVKAGKVKVVFKDFPFLGDDSITGAIYGQAVWELYPDKYFTWREAMFNAQDDEGDQGFGDDTSINKLDATITGIDAAKITKAVADNNDKYTKIVNAEKTEGGKFGVNGTPGFVIDKQSISGAQPYTVFQTAIDALLK